MLSGGLYHTPSTRLVYLLSPSWAKDHQQSSRLGHVNKVQMPFLPKQILANIICVINSLTSSFLLTVHSSFQVPSAIQTINYKNISSSSILLYWDPPEYPNGKITHYTIYATELDTHRAFQMTTGDTSFLITGRRKRHGSFCTPPPLIEICTSYAS